MEAKTWLRRLGLTACAAGALGIPALFAQDGDRGGKRSGEVSAWLRNPHGDVEGFSLKDGEEVRFPPHAAAQVQKALKPGDRVEVEGRREMRPKGERVFEAERITNGSQVITLDQKPPKPGSKEETMTKKGQVKELVTNRHGDIDGLLLADGMEVKMPPHQGAALKKLAAVGTLVKVEGRKHVTPMGEVHLHADLITAVDSGETLERDEPRPPGPKGPHAKGPAADRELQEELLRELKAVRRLLEARTDR